MKKLIILFILVFFIFPFCSAFAEQGKVKYKTKPFEYETTDGMLIKGSVIYPKVKLTKYPFIVFLHSIGTNSNSWGDIPTSFLSKGFAVVTIDMRGHGESIYDNAFKRKSRIYFNNKVYSKFPSDISFILHNLVKENKKLDGTHYGFIGVDLGANVSILASEKLMPKPMFFVLVSPSLNFKGLYTPVKYANLGAIPTLVFVSESDRHFLKEAKSLKKFAQGRYDIIVVPKTPSGMLLVKNTDNFEQKILDWIYNITK